MALEAPYKQKAWSLDELFSDPKQAAAAFGRIETLVSEFEGRLDELAPDITADAFLSLVRQLETITTEMHRLYSYAGLWFAADTQDQSAQALVAKIDQFSAQTDNRVLPFELWWKELDEANAIRLLDVSGDWRYWLETMRLFKPHTLTEAEEKIINIKDTTGVSALQTLYDLVTNRYTFTIEVDGEPKTLTRDALMTYAYSPDSALRAAAYQELYRVYAGDGPVLGQMYQTLVRDWRNEQVDLRRFASPIAARNLGNDVPDAVVDTLLDVCRSNAGLFQRFFRLKAKILGMDTAAALRHLRAGGPGGQNVLLRAGDADGLRLVRVSSTARSSIWRGACSTPIISTAR